MRHEEISLYQKCLALMETAQKAIQQFRTGFAFLADQLRRSRSSVAHNFAEGYDQDSRRQERRFFGSAIQSAREASTSSDMARAFRAVREQTVEIGKTLALDLVRMISKFDGGRGRQVSETGLRAQAAGPGAQAAGDRLPAMRPAEEESEP